MLVSSLCSRLIIAPPSKVNHRLFHFIVYQMGIDQGGGDPGMTQGLLYNVNALGHSQEISGKGMPEHVRGDIDP